jgi:hypothetical protein
VILAVSPYHLTTRELPAMASLQLASRVVTFMPGVFRTTSGEGGLGDVRAAAKASERYARLMASWEWSMPLWREGAIVSSHAEDDAADDMRAVWERLAADDRYAAMRPFVRQSFGEDRGELIEAVAHDVLRGGPDPAISVPLVAGLDRFACRHGLTVARAEPASVAQKAELNLAEPVARVVIPMVMRGSAEAILDTRAELAEELDDLRSALGRLASLAVERPLVEARQLEAATLEMKRAALTYEGAFSRAFPSIEAARDRSEVTLRAGAVSLMLCRLPADAVLRSSCTAATAMLPSAARPKAKKDGAEAKDSGTKRVETLPVLADVLDHGSLAAIIVRAVGKPAATPSRGSSRRS